MDKYKQFITANTHAVTLDDLTNNHVNPVHLKDNEPMISHQEFINSVLIVCKDVLGEPSEPVIRVSHPIKGRIPEARNKPSKELLPHEVTLFYERMAWTVSFPSIIQEIDGEVLELTVGGVKAYNLDNRYTTKGAPEYFKLFIGFKNQVCTNLCISTDGYSSRHAVTEVASISEYSRQLFNSFDVEREATVLLELREVTISEYQFAHILGRIKLFNAMPNSMKQNIPMLGVSDSQLNTVSDEFFKDKVHGRDTNGSIDLWRVYNLLTSANKSSYIDTFLDRNVCMLEGIVQIKDAIQSGSSNFYLS